MLRMAQNFTTSGCEQGSMPYASPFQMVLSSPYRTLTHPCRPVQGGMGKRRHDPIAFPFILMWYTSGDARKQSLHFYPLYKRFKRADISLNFLLQTPYTHNGARQNLAPTHLSLLLFYPSHQLVSNTAFNFTFRI